MIRITCPSCGSKLNAKDELAGQTRKCPKCGRPIRIAAAATDANGPGADETRSDRHVLAAGEERLPVPDLPDRLNRDSHYLICDKTQLVATWENNGKGWMVRAHGGFVPAKRNREALPPQGDFKLVELKFTMTPDGRRLAGLTSYRLVERWALSVLNEDDDHVVEKITDLGFLNRDQKFAVRKALRDQFMRQVWEGASKVLEYLGNVDYHSPGVD